MASSNNLLKPIKLYKPSAYLIKKSVFEAQRFILGNFKRVFSIYSHLCNVFCPPTKVFQMYLKKENVSVAMHVHRSINVIAKLVAGVTVVPCLMFLGLV